MSRENDILIIGGGVIGLSIAWALAREGVQCTVLDRRDLGREASWAGAGMVPPAADADADAPAPKNPSSALRAWSARLYPEWSAALEEETGIDVGYRRCGGVDVAWDDREDQALRVSAGQWKAEGIAFERLAPADFQRVEPALSRSIHSAYFLPDRANVRNPRLLRGLMAAVLKRGGELRPWHAVEELPIEGDGDSRRIGPVLTSAGAFPYRTVIVAAGAWSEALLEGVGLTVPTPPVKGQIVLLKGERPLLRRIVENGTHYLVPRDDGRVLVGATEAENGFDARTSYRDAQALLAEALRLCPILKEAEIEATWAGLRPGNRDGRPSIGFAPGIDNLIIATGHKRAGLQLAPATAELVADLVLGRPPRLDPAAFRPGRPLVAANDEDVFRS